MRLGPGEIEALNADHWFAGLTEARRAVLVERGAGIRVADGYRVYGAGDPPNGLWAVVEGQVRLLAYPASGTEVLIRILGAGSWFGELSSLDGGPRPQDAVAYGQALLLHLSMAAIARLVDDYPDVYRDLGLLACAHQRAALSYIGQRVSQPTPARLARALSNLFEETGGGPVGVRQAELAVLVGVGRQTLNRELKRLEREGVLSADYASITVHDLERLRTLAGRNLDGLTP